MTRSLLRAAKPSDAGAIARVHVDTWRSAYAGLVPDAYLIALDEKAREVTWRHGLQQAQRHQTTLVVQAPDSERVVGFGSCGPARRDGLTNYAGEVYALYVAVDWQGQGLGRRLLSGLFAALAKAEMNDTFLWVLAGNPTRFFYQAMGGQAVAERQEGFAGVLLDEVAYSWPNLTGWLKEN